MSFLSRRRLLGGAAALGLTAASGALSGCGSSVSISSDPGELVLWYWARSVNPDLLAQAAKQIPGSNKFLRGDVIGGTFDTKLRTAWPATHTSPTSPASTPTARCTSPTRSCSPI